MGADDAYRQSGVDYDLLDAAKRTAMAFAAGTSDFAQNRGALAVDGSRGEPAFVFDLGRTQLALVQECLGTKSSLARYMQETHGANHFKSVGYDTVAAVVNDLVSIGALPLVVNAYFATGTPRWYQESGRFESLAMGWRDACRDAGAIWGGGESPMLSGIVEDGEIDLAGCGLGVIPPDRRPLIGDQLRPGDEIVLVASAGLHANGASLARRYASDLDEQATSASEVERELTPLLQPSIIYVRLLEAVYEAGLPIHYASHITGHGLRKIMRADRQLTYRIRSLPETPKSLSKLVSELGLSDVEAYSTFNMGVGFALYCPIETGERIMEVCEQEGYTAVIGGVVEEGVRSVELVPLDVRFDSDDLRIR